MAEGRLLQDDAVRGCQALFHRIQAPGGRCPIAQPHARHDADALRLDEDLPFCAFLRADRVAKIIIGAAEPVAIPAVLPDRCLPCLRRFPGL